MLPTLPMTRLRGLPALRAPALGAGWIGAWLRHAGLTLLAMGVAASTLTLNSVIFHDRVGNYFPEFSGQVVYLSDVLLGVGALAWLAAWLARGRGRLRAGPWYVWAPLALLAGLSALSLLWADHQAVAQLTVARRTLLLLVYVILVNEARRAGPIVAVALIGLGTTHALVALAQAYEHSALGLGILGELKPGMLNYEVIGRPRGFGLGFNPNPAGVFIATGVLLAYGTLLAKGRRGWLTACAAMALLVSIAGVGATGSRSAVIGLALGGAAITAAPLLRDRLRRLAPYAVHATILLVIAGGGFILATSSGDGGSMLGLERFSPSSLRGGVAVRSQNFSWSFPIIREHVTRGVGAGNYPMALKEEIAPDAVAPKLTPVHNVPLLVLAELGPVGLAAWAVVAAAPLLWLARVLAGARRPSSRALLWAGPLVLVLVESMFDFTPWATQDGRIVFIALVALWAGSLSRADRVHRPRGAVGRVPATGGGRSGGGARRERPGGEDVSVRLRRYSDGIRQRHLSPVDSILVAGFFSALLFLIAAPFSGAVASVVWLAPTPPPPRVNLGVVMSDAPDPVEVGDPLTYTITVTNFGSTTATGVTLEDDLPGKSKKPEVIFVSATASQGSCGAPAGSKMKIECALGTIAGGDSVVVMVVVEATPRGVGALQNKVSVEADLRDLHRKDNKATERTVVVEGSEA